MSSGPDIGGSAAKIFEPNDVEAVLTGSFYTPRARPRPRPRPRPATAMAKPKPTHYKVICISMYTDALRRLDDMVSELKARGYTKANRSALIRHALDVVDLDKVPRGI